MRLRNKFQSQSGFTLVELLVVAVLLGILSTVLFKTLNGAAETRRNLEESTQASTEARQILTRIGLELSSRVTSAVRDITENENEAGKVSNQKRFVLGFHLNQGDSDTDTLRFVSRGHGATFGDVQIDYRLTKNEDAEGTYNFERAESPSGLLPDKIVKDRTIKSVLSQNVKSFRVRYLKATKAKAEWQNEWQGPDLNLPGAVEINLVIKSPNGTEHTFRTAYFLSKPPENFGFRTIGS